MLPYQRTLGTFVTKVKQPPGLIDDDIVQQQSELVELETPDEWNHLLQA